MGVEDLIISKKLILEIQSKLDAYPEFDFKAIFLAEDVQDMLRKAYLEYTEEILESEKEFSGYILELSAY